MTQNIHFELVSPEAKLVSEPVSMAVIPAMEGEMGVGAKHASFVVTLKAGVVKLYKDGQSGTPVQSIFVAGGFADITGESCTVLAEEAVNVNDLDKADIESVLKDLNEDLNMADEPADKLRIRQKIEVMEAKRNAAS